MAMGAVAVASSVLPNPGGTAGTQYSDVQAGGGPPDQSSKPNVPAPEGNSDPIGNGDPEGENVPPDTSPGGGNQEPGGTQTQPSEPGGGNDQGGGDTGSGAGNSGSDGKGQSNGNGRSEGNGQSNGKGNGNGNSGSSGGSSSGGLSQTAQNEAEVLALVNDERQDAGCKPVKASSKLAELAGDFSRSMAVEGFFSHLGPDGSSPWDRAEDLGVLDLGGENIARGQESPKDVVDDWMRSPSHRANILNCEYRTMGVGEYIDEDGPWWTQDFGY